MKIGTQKKQNPPQHPPGGPPADGQLDPETGIIETEFTAMIRDAVYGPGIKPIWPKSDLSDLQANEEIKAAVELLFLRCEGKPLPSEIHPAESLPHIIRERLIATPNWPIKEPPRIPERFKEDKNAHPPRPNRKVAFRRYEVACAFNIIMKAFHAGIGGGGSGTEWPPQRP
jgi:hypothetical protein